ncbi:MAG TPA: helicase-related protein [Thermoguttaceae bacterium]|nr:helicase-related protein [Thermoguttaceae bacterium]
MHGKMVVLMRDVTKALCAFLERSLPRLKADWWASLVLPALSFQQRRIAEQQGTASLAKLDLAALMRVLDQNWHVISQAENLTLADRNYLKEMCSVRNRWAHVAMAGISDDDAYRDLDTLQRFAAAIGAENDTIEAIKVAKSELRPRAVMAIPPPTEGPPKPPETEFTAGQIVAPKSNLANTGAVVAVIPGQPENRYTVFHSGASTTYYASQLQAIQSVADSAPWLSLPEFHAHLSALQICQPSLSNLYSLNAAKVDFVPYQYRPVLKFIHSDRPRLLIADGVGVGKTIEAELILRELQARTDVQSVLIICPKPLIVERKWELELKRFDERFTHLDGGTLRYCIDEADLEGEWPELHCKTIIPYSLFDQTLLHGETRGTRRCKGLLDLDPPPRFDLVIVDEAHRIRNTETYTHDGVRFFCDNAEAVLFLTATPVQLGSDDLFVLLNVLRPDLIIDRESFAHMAAPNPHINRAVDLVRSQQAGWNQLAREAMAEAASTDWGRSILQDNPEFQRVYDMLASDSIGPEQRVDAINSLEQLHSFSRIINRTRRRDIGQFTIRRPETVEVPFTPEQKELHDSIMAVQAAILTRLHGNRSVKFLMTTIRRQAASCLFGLAPLLENILTRRIDELTWQEADDAPDSPDAESLVEIESQISAVLTKAENLPSDDPKLAALCRIIGEKQTLNNNKVIVFSSFRHTLSYLQKHIKKDSLRVGMVHGDTPDEDRVELRNRFRLSKSDSDALDVLLFSEVGCEGLDYEFCDCMVNYDLPWNPMRIEQRIGRIDRRGQKSEYVTVYNLVTPGTVDAEIYHRCLWRIGVFEREIGASEEILGQITREIRDIAENLSLTPNEQREKLQQLADNQIRLIREQQELEDKQAAFFGLKLPELQTKKDIEDASSYWLSSQAIHNLVVRYLQDSLGTGQEYILGDKPLKTLRLSQEARDRLLNEYRAQHRRKGTIDRQWEEWLKGAAPHLTITFDAPCAVDHPEAVLLGPLHPLVRQAATARKPPARLMTACAVLDDSIPSADYPFAVYQWRFHGLREDVQLRAVSMADVADAQVIQLLERAQPIDLAGQDRPAPSVFDTLESRHYAEWRRTREEHRERIQQLAGYRRESLKVSHAARMTILKEQLSRATDEKIRRMRQSQIASAEADYSRRTKELDDAIVQADITSTLVAQGVVRVTRK